MGPDFPASLSTCTPTLHIHIPTASATLQILSYTCQPALVDATVSSVHPLSFAGASRSWRERSAPAPPLHPHHPPPHPLATLRVHQQPAVVLQIALRSILSRCRPSPRPRASGFGRAAPVSHLHLYLTCTHTTHLRTR